MEETYEELCEIIGECIAVYEVKDKGKKFVFGKNGWKILT